MNTRPPALAKGEPVRFDEDLPAHPLGIIQQQIDQNPRGRLLAWRLSGEPDSASYAELYERSAEVVSALRERGLARGDFAVLLFDDVLQFVPTLWACLRAGVVPVPLNSQAASAQRSRDQTELGRVLGLVPGAHVLYDSSFADLATALKQPRTAFAELQGEPDDSPDTPNQELLWLVPTTGSTGGVKLVQTRPGNLLARQFRAKQRTESERRRTLVNTFAYDSITGLRVTLADADLTLHIRPQDFAARPLSLLQAIEQVQAQAAALTCSAAALILHAQAETGATFDLSSWQRIRMGAERIDPVVARRFAEMVTSMGAAGEQLGWGYGASETGLIAEGCGLAEVTPAHEAEGVVPLGRCAGGTWIRIADETDQVMREGEIGDVQVYGPEKLFPGYQGDPGASRACTTDDGWYRTGDRGRLEDGVLTLTGRAKELFIRQGRKFALEDVDRAARGLPMLTECAVLSALSVASAGEASESLVLALVPPAGVNLRPGDVLGALNAVLGKTLGVTADAVALLELEQVPRSATGKVLRAGLARMAGAGEMELHAEAAQRAEVPGAAQDADHVQQVRGLWSRTLGLRGRPDEVHDFFELGGDSLKSAQLLAGVEELQGRPVDAARFFERPTLAMLLSLLDAPVERAPADAQDEPWPLPAELHNDLLSYLGAWGGGSFAQAPLVRGWHLNGSRRPLFWVLQDNREASRLAEALGPDQPLYVLRSGLGVMDYNEDQVQRLALNYVGQIQALADGGPIFVGGNCQGAIIALAAAQHLQRRRVELPLLVLVEWGFQLTPYSGPVLLLHGENSLVANPDHRYRQAELGRRRAMPNWTEVQLPGGHGRLFRPGNVEPLVRVLQREMDDALSAVPLLMPASAYRADIGVVGIPGRLNPRQALTLRVRVTNLSERDWPTWAESGFALSCAWSDRTGEVRVGQGGHAPMPTLAVGAHCDLELPIRAPLRRGTYDLTVDLQEEGGAWFRRFGSTPWKARIRVGVRLPWES